MCELSYHAVVKTPSGYRIGKITSKLEDGKTSGELSLTDFNGRYFGTIEADGCFEIEVERYLSADLVKCRGSGRLSIYSIHITIDSSGVIYELDGTAE